MSRNTVGVLYKNVIRYTGPSANIVHTVKHCKEPTILDKNHNLMTIWLVGDNPQQVQKVIYGIYLSF